MFTFIYFAFLFEVHHQLVKLMYNLFFYLLAWILLCVRLFRWIMLCGLFSIILYTRINNLLVWNILVHHYRIIQIVFFDLFLGYSFYIGILLFSIFSRFYCLKIAQTTVSYLRFIYPYFLDLFSLDFNLIFQWVLPLLRIRVLKFLEN